MAEQILSRRGFLAAGTLGVAAATGLRAFAVEEEKPAAAKKIPVGIQLYTVRNECAKDLPATLAAIAKIGYKGVDFAGYHGRTAQQLRRLLDDNGLVCCGTHTGMNTLLGDELAKTIEFNKTIGNKYLVVPGGIGGRTKRGWLDAAARFNDIAEKLKPEGMLCGYHNHAHEFQPIEGETPWDIFYGAAKPEVIMQVDTGNCMGGGGDPVAILKKFPGRAITVHLKEFGANVIGEGKVDWKSVFDLCETTGRTEWYIVEQDAPGEAPLDTAARCFENLKKMGKV